MPNNKRREDVLSIPHKSAQILGKDFKDREELTITASSKSYLMGEQIIVCPKPILQLVCRQQHWFLTRSASHMCYLCTIPGL